MLSDGLLLMLLTSLEARMVKTIIKSGIIALLAGMLSVNAFAESADDEVRASCEQEATDAGITNADERADFIQRCIEDARAASGSDK